MARAKSKQLKLYLTSWQKRMVADFTSKAAMRGIRQRDLTKVLITYRPGGCLASYKLPPGGIRKDDWMLYLTDEQMKMVSEEFGLRQRITAVNFSPQEIEAGNIQFG